MHDLSDFEDSTRQILRYNNFIIKKARKNTA